jgi:flagellar biosynthetic protein FliP
LRFRRGLIPFLLALPGAALAADGTAVALPALRIGVDRATNPGDVSLTLQILFLITILSLAPAILMMLTSFTRIVIVLSFLRNAMGTPTMPPNQVMIGLSLFLTFFIMNPVLKPIYDNAYVPYSEGQITQMEALDRAKGPLKGFMLRYTSEKDIAMFVRLSKEPRPRTPNDVSMTVLIPSFMISELRTAFTMGFLIYIPFVVVDMVVASVLMSMGMFMLPPMMISLPFKLILFVVVDGWGLVIGSLTRSFTG